MSIINQCTFDITGTARLLQYFRICLTCSKDGNAVEVCLNCASICHEKHRLGPLIREKFSCQCHLKSKCCRASLHLNDGEDSQVSNGDVNNNISGKRRKLFNGHDMISGVSSWSRKYVIWSQLDKRTKVIIAVVKDIENANNKVKEAFVDENPWGLEEHVLKSYPSFTSSYDGAGLLHYQVMSKDSKQLWHVTAQLAENFLKEYEPLKARSDASQADKDHNNNNNNNNNSNNNNSNGSNKKDAPAFRNPWARDVDLEELVRFKDILRADEVTDLTEGDKKTKKVIKPRLKEVGAPKGPMASFMFYSNSVRSSVLKAYPELSMVNISRKIGEMWKELDPEVKAPFDEMAKQDRDRYMREKEEFEQRKIEFNLPTVYMEPKVKGKPGPKAKKSPSELDGVDPPKRKRRRRSRAKETTPEKVNSPADETTPSPDSAEGGLDLDVDEDGEIEDDSSEVEEEIDDEESDPAMKIDDESEASDEERRFVILKSTHRKDASPKFTSCDTKFTSIDEANEYATNLFYSNADIPHDKVDKSMQDGCIALTVDVPNGNVWSVKAMDEYDYLESGN